MKKLSFPIKYHCCVCIYMHIYNNKGMEKKKKLLREGKRSTGTREMNWFTLSQTSFTSARSWHLEHLFLYLCMMCVTLEGFLWLFILEKNI